jgi:hypothetical protein
MPLGSVLVLLLLATATACGIGALYCREVIIDELQQRSPYDAPPRFPRSSWSFFELMRLHRQYCPGSRIRAVTRTLIQLGLCSMITIALMGAVSVFSKPPLQRGADQQSGSK